MLEITLVKTWDNYAKIYDALMRTPVFNRLGEASLRALPSCPGGLVHDGGTGTGFWLKRLLDITQAGRIIATDLSAEMLSRAEERIKRLPRDYWSRIDLRQMDLMKEWPGSNFSLQFFQLLPNYLPGDGWKRLLESAAETTLLRGVICSATMLKGLNVKRLARKHIIEQMLHTPFYLYPAMIRSSRIMGVFDALSRSGEITPPAREEYLSYHKKVGFEKIEEVGEAFWGAALIVKAEKAEVKPDTIVRPAAKRPPEMVTVS